MVLKDNEFRSGAHHPRFFSPENPGKPLIPTPGPMPKFSSFVVGRRRVRN